MGSSCSATIFGNGDASSADASSVLSCLYDGEILSIEVKSATPEDTTKI